MHCERNLKINLETGCAPACTHTTLTRSTTVNVIIFTACVYYVLSSLAARPFRLGSGRVTRLARPCGNEGPAGWLHTPLGPRVNHVLLYPYRDARFLIIKEYRFCRPHYFKVSYYFIPLTVVEVLNTVVNHIQSFSTCWTA